MRQFQSWEPQNNRWSMPQPGIANTVLGDVDFAIALVSRLGAAATSMAPSGSLSRPLRLAGRHRLTYSLSIEPWGAEVCDALFARR